MKCELLSPVGNIETLYYAIAGGADSVYLSGKEFGARAFAKNFSNEEIKKAIDFAHLYGVKVYVTINTIIYQDEVDSCINYIKYLYLNNVDALIMQDLGMIKKVKTIFPNLEIHASTQCHNHNKESILALEQLGISRVVLDREMDLATIKNLNIPIEKEIFIHGALCVSYSGCCLFSSLNGGRSGNRGLCVGNCRLPYKLIQNDKTISTNGNYLLSMKELNTTDKINEILSTDVKCLKIEGRMKSKEYVGYVTKMYRKLIDSYYSGQPTSLTQNEQKNLALLYNRKFTSGYLFNNNVINIKSSNHVGIKLGKVIDVNQKKIKIKLEDDLYQEDAIKFMNENLGMIVNKLYNEKGLLINKALKNQIVILDNKVGLKTKDIVNKTIDNKLLKEIRNYKLPSVPIDIKVIAKIGKQLKIEFSDGMNIVSYVSDIVVEANNKPTTKDIIIEKISKLGNTAYKANIVNIEIDNNIFINVSSLNNIRRILVDLLNKKRTKNTKNIIINDVSFSKYENQIPTDIKINVLVRNEEQLICCLKNDINDIYITDYKLYTKYKNNKNIYYQTTRVNPKLLSLKNENILATELSSITHYSKDNNVVSDYYLNVVNNETINYLEQLNVKRITLSLELNEEKLKILNHKKTELVIYGRACVMITKYCPLKENVNNCSNCKNNKNKYFLEDRLGYRFPIVHNNCLISIMDCKIMDNIVNINNYIKMGISNFRLELFDETADDIDKILNKLQKIVKTYINL